MGGLRRICKMHGGMIIQGVEWRWDYVADEPVEATEMPDGSDRWKASEREKYRIIAQVDRNPKGHDAEERHGRNDESPVANGDAPQVHNKVVTHERRTAEIGGTVREGDRA